MNWKVMLRNFNLNLNTWPQLIHFSSFSIHQFTLVLPESPFSLNFSHFVFAFFIFNILPSTSQIFVLASFLVSHLFLSCSIFRFFFPSFSTSSYIFNVSLCLYFPILSFFTFPLSDLVFVSAFIQCLSFILLFFVTTTLF